MSFCFVLVVFRSCFSLFFVSFLLFLSWFLLFLFFAVVFLWFCLSQCVFVRFTHFYFVVKFYWDGIALYWFVEEKILHHSFQSLENLKFAIGFARWSGGSFDRLSLLKKNRVGDSYNNILLPILINLGATMLPVHGICSARFPRQFHRKCTLSEGARIGDSAP